MSPAAGIADDRKGWLFRTSPGHNATVRGEQAEVWSGALHSAVSCITFPQKETGH
jgi:hypothetical protein